MPKIAGRNDDDERLALIIWPPFLSCEVGNGPIAPDLLYRNCRALAEETFAQRYDNWEENSKENPTRLVVCGLRTEIRADALIATDLTTWCCSFMCEVLEYHADYLLDGGNTGRSAKALRPIVNVLVDETHHDKWLPGVQSVNLCGEDVADAFWQAVRETVFRCVVTLDALPGDPNEDARMSAIRSSIHVEPPGGTQAPRRRRNRLVAIGPGRPETTQNSRVLPPRSV